MDREKPVVFMVSGGLNHFYASIINKRMDAPVLEADYVKLEFLRLGKTNLTCRVLPGVDHSFYEVVVEDGKEKGISHRKEAFQMIIDWIDSN